MSKEWKVETAGESDLEKVLQGLDADAFDVYGIFPARDSLKSRFVVVGRRDLPEGRKKRRYEARPVAVRASNGLLLRWLGNSQPLHAVSRSAGDPETFWMIRLEGVLRGVHRRLPSGRRSVAVDSERDLQRASDSLRTRHRELADVLGPAAG